MYRQGQLVKWIRCATSRVILRSMQVLVVWWCDVARLLRSVNPTCPNDSFVAPARLASRFRYRVGHSTARNVISAHLARSRYELYLLVPYTHYGKWKAIQKQLGFDSTGNTYYTVCRVELSTQSSTGRVTPVGAWLFGVCINGRRPRKAF